MENRNSQCEHGQPMEQTRGFFANATQVWLTVNNNTSVTSGKRNGCLKRIARASALGSCQSNFCHS